MNSPLRADVLVFSPPAPPAPSLSPGPWCLNGVPLRRVNQAYVVGTSTVVDLAGVQIPEAVGDEYFKKEAKANRKQAKSFMDVDVCFSPPSFSSPLSFVPSRDKGIVMLPSPLPALSFCLLLGWLGLT